jgi:glucose-1-phosphate thymidylyltransferase
MLMLAGLRQILVISTPAHLPSFRDLLRDGSQWGLAFHYAAQPEPRGLAESFLIGEDFLAGEPVCLILGDNIFYGHGMPETMRTAASLQTGALVFAYPVKDPSRYGVIEIDPDGQVLSIEEKPAEPRSHFAIPGIYFFDGRAAEFARQVQPSERGELEITEVQRAYMERGELRAEVMGRGVAWLDAGTHQSLMQAAQFVQAVQERQGLMISCPEEIAYRLGYISADELAALAEEMGDNQYSAYLLDLARHAPTPPIAGAP